MTHPFFDRPVLNSPYEYPSRHWELDENGQPTEETVGSRRAAQFITPVPKPRKKRGKAEERTAVLFDEGRGISTERQRYEHTALINSVRRQVDRWRNIGDPGRWQVTPETARLLQHWRSHRFSDIRPFFCQVEAVETAVWLTEVAPHAGETGRGFLDHLAGANDDANPELQRLALKLATGAGKTTVMAMLIAWQTVNAVRRPRSRRFTRGFLVVTPGLTIKDRLRVLQPHDPDSYYRSRELVPADMLPDLARARIVITNYHAFKQRERLDLSRTGRSLLQGRGEAPRTLETEGQMLQRVMPELMGIRNVLVLNDEAHHCYREKPKDGDGGEGEERPLTAEEQDEAKQNSEAARLWISGLEAVGRKLGVNRVLDLSATPFFLRGSGYAEGTLFPWTLSDFSLMDAIECGIVKLPRAPVADNVPGEDMPKLRNLWEHIRGKMPKRGRGKAKTLDPLSLPAELLTALDALYGHYEKVFRLWREADIGVPPCFIVVCNNTSASKLVYDYVSGFHREKENGVTSFAQGRLPLFRNFDDGGVPLPRPNTLLIDSEQLESGELLDADFRKMAADEIVASSFHTPPEVADRLVRWVVRSPSDRLLDPACGDGRFLAAHSNVVGVDRDGSAVAAATGHVPHATVHTVDFFDWADTTEDRFDCLAGNPPFIRYQRFNGHVRKTALKLCERLGVRLTGLASSWAPFVIVAASLLERGGRMAFVVPAEIGHAPYAQPVVQFLFDNFSDVRVAAVREKVFPNLSEAVWFLYASGFGKPSDSVGLSSYNSFRDVPGLPLRGERISRTELKSWNNRLRPLLLSRAIRGLYSHVGHMARLGDCARVGIDYVTGANDFFHISPSKARRLNLQEEFLTPSLRRSAFLPQKAVTHRTVQGWLNRDEPVLLLNIPARARLPTEVRHYLDSSAGRKARTAYKCRKRSPWYAVPDVRVPDAFLGYMSGLNPALVADYANCGCTNSVHAVHLTSGVSTSELVRRWSHPLVALSCEIEGHPLGGGLLKLEPREAARVVLPALDLPMSKNDQEMVEEGVGALRRWRLHAEPRVGEA